MSKVILFVLGGVKDDTFGGELRVLACADTGARSPLGVRQYSNLVNF
jgi:hypothetical protein